MGMEPFVQADSFASLLAHPADPLKAIEQQIAFKTGIDSQQVDNQFKQAQIGAAAQKQQRMAQYQGAMQAYLANPSANGLASLLGQFPEFSDESKAAFGALDGERQKAELTQMGEITALASGGNWKGAADALRARIEADKAAGHVDPMDQRVLENLDSGDPARQKEALGLLTYSLGVAVGPEHAKSFLESQGWSREPNLTVVAPGSEVIDQNNPGGGSVYSSPYRPQTITGADGTVYQLVPKGTRAAGSGQPNAATGGFDAAVEHVLGNEGGYNPSDMNGAPVNFGINQGANPGVDVKNLTRDQAKQIYLDKYWKPSGAESLPANMQAPYFDVYIRNPKVAKSALAQSKGDPAKFADITSSYFEKLAKTPKGKNYANAWADRDAKNRAIATGGGAGVEATAQAGGRTFYKIGGKWFDNPEGK